MVPAESIIAHWTSFLATGSVRLACRVLAPLTSPRCAASTAALSRAPSEALSGSAPSGAAGGGETTESGASGAWASAFAHARASAAAATVLRIQALRKNTVTSRLQRRSAHAHEDG